MMKDLTPQEIDVARKIISAGLVKSAESLSFFMNETISLKDFDAEKNLDNPPLELGKKDESNIHLLTTKVIGEMKGICCLIFSEEEANHLRKAALPQEILDSPEMMEEMSDGIMLEVDNIISASVITQISNKLKQKVYGDVPKMTLNDYIQNTKRFMKENFFSYHPNTNNCQDFISAILQANGIKEHNVYNFVKQDTSMIFKDKLFCSSNKIFSGLMSL